MAVNIVTGMTGIEHITSHDDRARNASQFGRGKYVFNIGRKFSATAVDDNLVRIQDGMCINQGTQMGIEPNDYADVEIDNGLLGTNRHDIIVMRYEKNEETLLEKASLAVVKGVNSSEPVDPDITEGNILDGGDLVDDMPLYRVIIEGVNLVSVEPLFEVFDGDVGSILEELGDKVDKVEGKGLSTNDYTNEDKTKLDDIETGAEANVQSDWSQNDDTADDFIKHKPSIPSKTSDLQNDSDFVSDANYVHTDNNYTDADKEDVAKIDDIEHSLSTTKTATGNPISISDSAHVNAEELTVELEPKQDLHGYDNPWVGGAGKNLLPMTVDGIKSTNTSGTWSGNAYTISNMTFTVMTDSDGNVTGINLNGTATSDVTFNLFNSLAIPFSGEYKFIGISDFWGGRAALTCSFSDSSQVNIYATTITESKSSNLTRAHFYIWSNNTFSNTTIYPMVMLATETDPTFEPYSNICPISGYDETSVVIKDTAENPTVTNTYTLQFGDTVYGAEVDFVSGVATVTKGYIAEYAGETLPSTWISDRDVYASGTTPTTGAEVVYELATPYTIQLTPQQIKMLKGNNVLVADGDMELTYQLDSVVGDVKEWAENEFLPKSLATAQHNYSTQEQVVGTWIDGKTLYEKTLHFTGTYTGAQSLAIGVSNLDIVIPFIAFAVDNYDSIVPLPYVNGTAELDPKGGWLVNSSKEYINIRFGSSFVANELWFTIQYTKTTD